MKTIERMESEVRSYCRNFPVVFKSARGHMLEDRDGRAYIDFFSGAGALNYGHNHPVLKERLLSYIQADHITHALDMATEAKETFLEVLERLILHPRDLAYKVMFTGPTGTNAVEAAIKLARKVTGRTNVIAFTNGFHGMTLGALALTGNQSKRDGAGVPLNHVFRMPYDRYGEGDCDTCEMVEQLLEDPSSGVPAPAAIVLETVQAEGGINVASVSWLRRMRKLAHRVGALFIVDDIQVGCGRTGPFFSFGPAGFRPDIVCLSKSISGYGLPLALNLIKPELDIWEPGEHNGTFRGHMPAFVTATAALEHFWNDDALYKRVNHLGHWLRDELESLAAPHGGVVRGRGLIQGIAFPRKEAAAEISRAAFERGLILETSGPDDDVVKLLPPLNIPEDGLSKGLEVLKACVQSVRTVPAPVLLKSS